MNSIIFIIDSSESVNNYVENYVKTINSIIDEQKKLNPDLLTTIAFFNQTLRYRDINCPIKNINHITNQDINPQWTTSLYDNVSIILHNMSKFYDVNDQIPPVVVILTDGEDTSSHRLELKHLVLQIGFTKLKGWKYVFLGTDEKSMTVGKEIGANICIRYNQNENSFSNIPKLLAEVIKEKIYENENINFDIRSLTKSILNMKI
jgi:hypothetical protein